MPTGSPSIPHFSDSTPAPPTGRLNVKVQQGSPYSGTLVWNGQNYTVQFSDISWNFPNLGGVDARTTTSETIGLASQGKLVTLNNAAAIAVTLDSTVPSGFFCAIQVIGAGAATLTPSSGTIDGAASASLATLNGAWLFFDGTNWHSEGNAASLASVTSSVTALQNQMVIGFIMNSGATGTNVGPTLIAPRAGKVTKCKIVVHAADPSTDLTIKIKKNGTDVFSADPTVTHGSAVGTIVTSTSLTSSPLSIAADDLFTIDVSSGTSAWQFTAQLE